MEERKGTGRGEGWGEEGGGGGSEGAPGIRLDPGEAAFRPGTEERLEATSQLPDSMRERCVRSKEEKPERERRKYQYFTSAMNLLPLEELSK